MSGVPGSPAAARRRLFALALLAAVAGARAQPQATEVQVKAAYLYKFLAYVEWPKDTFARPDAPIVIGIVGAAALADELAQQVSGRHVEGRPVQVRKLAADDPVAGVHVLFVGADQEARLDRLVAASRGQPLLLVTESADGVAHGAAISFLLADQRVRFQVAQQPIESRGLRVSARLLAVAHKVMPGPM